MSARGSLRIDFCDIWVVERGDEPAPDVEVVPRSSSKIFFFFPPLEMLITNSDLRGQLDLSELASEKRARSICRCIYNADLMRKSKQFKYVCGFPQNKLIQS